MLIRHLYFLLAHCGRLISRSALCLHFFLFSVLRFSLYREEEWGGVSCSELPCFHIPKSVHNPGLSHELSASLFPCCCSGVEVRINKASHTVLSPSSGYACHCVKCSLHNPSFLSFNSLNAEHDSLKMLYINRHTIYRNVVPSLTFRGLKDNSIGRRTEIVLFGTAQSWNTQYVKWGIQYLHSELSCLWRRLYFLTH